MSEPSVEAAIETLLRDVYRPVFFGKLAEAGYEPADLEEAVAVLRFGKQAREQAIRSNAEQLSERGAWFSKAAAMLDADVAELSGRPAYGGVAAVPDETVKQAVDVLCGDAAVLAAAAALTRGA